MSKSNKVSRVLLVDDEPDLLEIYSEILVNEGFQVDSAQDVPSAIEKLQGSSFDLVVSDVGLPGAKGTEIISWVNANCPKTKVLLITGLSKEDAFDSLQLGCAGFLMKPLSSAELLAGVSSTLKLGGKLELLSSDALARVSVSQFLIGKKAPFPLYLQMPDGRFVKLADRGQEMNPGGLEKFDRNEVHRLSIRREDVTEYMNVCSAVGKMAVKRTDWTLEKRIHILNHAAEVALETIRLAGLNATTFYALVEAVKESTKLMPTCLNHEELLHMLSDSDGSLLARSVLGANFAAGTAAVMGWSSDRMIDTFVLATLLKDIGLLTMPEAYHGLDPRKLPSEMELEYKRHPFRGVDLLSGIAGIPKDVLTIVEQHHEGLGADSFPRNLPRANMIPLARMVQGVDRFLEVCKDLKRREPLTKERVLNGVFKMKQEGTERSLCFALEALFRKPSVARAHEWFRKEMSVNSNRDAA